MSVGYPAPALHQFFDANGRPLSGGLLYAFAAGTTTPKVIGRDAAMTPHSHPAVLDSAGRISIFVVPGEAYKLVLYDAAGAFVRQVDDFAIPAPSIPVPTQVVPTGAILPYTGLVAPPGYLLCDGSAVSRTTYADLFAIQGTLYGAGDGATTFNLPNLRQRFPLGLASSGTGSVLGATGGAIDHTHTISSQDDHTHGPTGPAGAHDHGGTTGEAGAHAHGGETGTAGAHDHGGTTGPPNATVNNLDPNGGTAYPSASHLHDIQAEPAHTHAIASVGDHAHTLTSEAAHTHTTAAAGAHAHGGETGGQNPPFVVVNYIVKT